VRRARRNRHGARTAAGAPRRVALGLVGTDVLDGGGDEPAEERDELCLAGRERIDLGAGDRDHPDRPGAEHQRSDELAAQSVAAGQSSGERVCAFPQDDDYDNALDSTIADVKQCSLDSAADHILATLFLKRFTGDIPWIHVDLSASSSKGGLGAVSSDTTGFGVGWALELLAARIR